MSDQPARLPLARIGVVALVAVLAGTGLYALGASSAGPSPSVSPAPGDSVASPAAAADATETPAETASALVEPPAAVVPERTVADGGAFRLVPAARNACTADAPDGWTMLASDRSNTADLFDPAGTLYAGYGIQAVNTSLAGFAGYYDPPLNDPDLYSADPGTVALAYSRIILANLGGSPDPVPTEEGLVGDYRLLLVESSTHRGAIFHRAEGFPGDGVNYAYALPMYFAFTTSDRWNDDGALVARIAASIRCQTQFQPPDDYFVVEAGGDAGGTTDANGDDAGYNPQLGTEYVTDPVTGENYLVSPSESWSETGPDGPGYYAPRGGGDYQKLEPGRTD